MPTVSHHPPHANALSGDSCLKPSRQHCPGNSVLDYKRGQTCLVLSSLAELCKQTPCSAAPKMNVPFPRLQLPLQCEQQDAERMVVIPAPALNVSRAVSRPLGLERSIQHLGYNWVLALLGGDASSKSPSWAALRGTRYVVLG